MIPLKRRPRGVCIFGSSPFHSSSRWPRFETCLFSINVGLHTGFSRDNGITDFRARVQNTCIYIYIYIYRMAVNYDVFRPFLPEVTQQWFIRSFQISRSDKAATTQCRPSFHRRLFSQILPTTIHR